MRFVFGLLGLLLVTLALSVAIIAFFAVATEYVSVHGKLAAIEQLREDAQRVRGEEASGVLQLVVQANAKIAAYKALNAESLTGWFVPDDWDQVRLIRIRTFRQEEPKPGGSPPAGSRTAKDFGYTPNEKEAERFIRSLEKGAKP